jgi:hypothetical protein
MAVASDLSIWAPNALTIFETSTSHPAAFKNGEFIGT